MFPCRAPFLADLYEFHHEFKGAVGRDAAGSAVSVSKVVGQVKLILCAFTHKLKALCPALDNLIETKLDGLSPLV